MDTETTSAVADFWLAVGRNNLEEAEAAVLRLEAPLVSVSSGFSFDMVEGKGKDQGVDLEDEGALMGASPRGVMPGTPMSTIDAWNSDVGVSLIVVSKQPVGRECRKGISISSPARVLPNVRERLGVVSPPMNLGGRTVSSGLSSRWLSPRLGKGLRSSSSPRGVS